jgi:hypothetical protein
LENGIFVQVPLGLVGSKSPGASAQSTLLPSDVVEVLLGVNGIIHVEGVSLLITLDIVVTHGGDRLFALFYFLMKLFVGLDTLNSVMGQGHDQGVLYHIVWITDYRNK